MLPLPGAASGVADRAVQKKQSGPVWPCCVLIPHTQFFSKSGYLGGCYIRSVPRLFYDLNYQPDPSDSGWAVLLLKVLENLVVWLGWLVGMPVLVAVLVLFLCGQERLLDLMPLLLTVVVLEVGMLWILKLLRSHLELSRRK